MLAVARGKDPAHSYANENKRIMEAVAQRLVSLAEIGMADSKVVQLGARN